MMWIPLRSAKMNRRILGFHRRVWCPKWTPASRSCWRLGCIGDRTSLGLVVRDRHRLPSTGESGTRSRLESRGWFASRTSVVESCEQRIATDLRLKTRRALALRELEPFARLRTAGLFALDRASITRQQTEIAKLAA